MGERGDKNVVADQIVVVDCNLALLCLPGYQLGKTGD